MHKIKTVLRLAELGLSQRHIAASCQIGQATVSDYLRLAAQAGLKRPDVADWDEDRLRAALTPASSPAPSWRKTDEPDFAAMRRRLPPPRCLHCPRTRWRQTPRFRARSWSSCAARARWHRC